MWLAVHAGKVGPVGVVHVRGELDLATRPRLEQGLDALLDSGCARIVVDLGEVEFADLSGLDLLARAQRRARAEGGWLRVAAPPWGVRRILAVTDLGDILPVYPDAYEAITDAGRPRTGPPMPRRSDEDSRR
ncbi:STAS domain-containing protein [Pseudofrankia asymbiotica]|uniref:Anti-sigma factor antagonist n=1 Tax=Pseudofrankia asymbiotica TaxID=1834516 RepID=A0A1V2I6Y3_9ACTN|nr:STAS domain-containing protein [Pseudofrankia asymbiotica]ONH27504.1 hypothetical protein BL253_21655 [Pseudofrankia asymbiotica]